MVAYENKIVYLHLEQKVLVIQILIATKKIEPIDDQRWFKGSADGFVCWFIEAQWLTTGFRSHDRASPN